MFTFRFAVLQQDYFFVWALLARYGPLRPGSFNAVAKAPLRNTPLFGWLFKSVGFLFLARAWEADRARIGAWAARLADCDRPMWLVLYPEGTRFTLKAKAGSDKAAAAAGVAPLTGELLLPRPKGFVELVRRLPTPRFARVVDFTVCYIGADGATPVGWAALGTEALAHAVSGRLPVSRVEVHVDTLPWAALPLSHAATSASATSAPAASASTASGGDGGPGGDAEEAALKAWLSARWRRKEARLAAAAATGRLALAGDEPRGAEGDDRRVPAARVAAFAAIYAAAGWLLLSLAATSPAFRAYLLLSSLAMAALSRADPLWW